MGSRPTMTSAPSRLLIEKSTRQSRQFHDTFGGRNFRSFFDHHDHLDNISHPGANPLVIEPVVGSKCLTKVLINGGSGLNIVYIECNTPGVYIPLDNEYGFKHVISVDKTDAKF
jgi:hypothetical protein